MERKTIFVILAIAALYGGLWLFNHVNAWIGIVAVIIVAYVAIKIILLTLQNKKNNEK